MSSIKVMLGKEEYDVPKMNIGQIEDMTLLDASAKNWTFSAIAVLMRRSDPTIGAVRDVEARPEQVRDAIEKIMRNSGYNLPESKNAPTPDQNPGDEG